jgi:hypothetical protein
LAIYLWANQSEQIDSKKNELTQIAQTQGRDSTNSASVNTPISSNTNVVQLPLPSPTIEEAYDVQTLRKYNGKYPEKMIKNEKGLQKRLKNLLGANYKLYMSNWQVISPVDINQNILFTTGCAAHQCISEASYLAIDLTNNTISCGLLSDSKFGGKIKTFSEGNAKLPTALVNEINRVRQMRNDF